MFSSSDIPFDFKERIPLFQARVNGVTFDRFVLDTGAGHSFLSKHAASAIGFPPNEYDTVQVDSLRVGAVEFGPLEMSVRNFGRNRLDGLLGTREVSRYWLLLDFVHYILRFETQPTPELAQFSPLEIFRGRPLVRVEHMGHALRFVFDTASSACWLFARGQDRLRDVGHISHERERAKAAHSTLEVSHSMIVENMCIGGARRKETKFLLARPPNFGKEPPEDGILGTDIMDGSITVIDLKSGKLALRIG